MLGLQESGGLGERAEVSGPLNARAPARRHIGSAREPKKYGHNFPRRNSGMGHLRGLFLQVKPTP